MSTARLDRLTSLRFFAAFVLFGFHATAFFEGPTRTVMDAIFGQGRAGVSFFFILSGFVLAWSARAGDTPFAFYRRRFARIYPAYIAALALAAALLLVVDPKALRHGLLTPFLLQSWAPDSSTYFAVNIPAWSLSVEGFFYATFPLLIVALRRLGRTALWVICAGCIMVTATIAAYASMTVGPDHIGANTFAVWFAVYFPLTRLPEFVLGVCLALLVRRAHVPHIPWSIAVGLFIAVFAALSIWPSVFGVSAAWVIPFGALIVSAAQRDLRGTPGLLRHPWAVEAGAVSYCFYLLHHIFVLRLSQPGFAAIGISGWGAFFLALALSLAGAWVLHRVVELPMDRKLRGPSRPRAAILESEK